MTSSPNRSATRPGADAAVSIRRYVNEEIARVGERFDVSAEYEFLCECGDLGCELRVTMTVGRYRATAPGSVVGH